MRRLWLEVMLAGVLLSAAGCGGDPPAPKELTPEEEKQFEEQRQKERQGERKSVSSEQ
jgi:predicted small lipoprotein YifL